MKGNIGWVGFLTNSTAAALDSSLESTMSAVSYGLVLCIPGIYFSFSKFSSFPFMLSKTFGWALFYISVSQIFLISDTFCLRKIITVPHILPLVNMQCSGITYPKLKTTSQLISDSYEYIPAAYVTIHRRNLILYRPCIVINFIKSQQYALFHKSLF